MDDGRRRQHRTVLISIHHHVDDWVQSTDSHDIILPIRIRTRMTQSIVRIIPTIRRCQEVDPRGQGSVCARNERVPVHRGGARAVRDEEHRRI